MADPVAAHLAALGAHRAAARPRILDLFAADPGRFERLSLEAGGLLLDASKTHIDAKALDLLTDLARAADVPGAIERMMTGAVMNPTEKRAVLHTALRDLSGRSILVDGRNIAPDVAATRARALAFAEGVRTAKIAAADGQPFTDVVNIGIGGSDLGPAMVVGALEPYRDGPRCHFVSNVDGAHIADTLKGLDPRRTLVLVASKTFTTIETMTNAATARRWIVAALGEGAVTAHFAAMSTAADKVAAFGIAEDRAFGFWDWVGGRYSLWSSIGLPIMMAIGAARFLELLAGAHAIDTHARTAPIERNMAIRLGLVGVWHRSVMGYGARAVIPYAQRLARLPAFLQQLDMESNGKSVGIDGAPARHATGPIVFGEPGTNGQHAFFQLLHQGTDVIPVEFLVAAEGHEPDLAHHQRLLIANCLAQGEALMRGKTLEVAAAELRAKGMAETDIAALAPHKVFPGDRPSVTIAFKTLDPATLGAILALYEHRVFVESVIWGINAFDQWGVELGKELATRLQPVVEGRAGTQGLDGSTAGLVRFLG